MTKPSTIITAVAAALFMSSGAMAASLQPAAGNAPYFDQPVTTSSTLTRSAVEAQAVASLPLAGDAPIVQQAAAVDPVSTLTRAQVEAQAAVSLPAAGQMNAMDALNASVPADHANVQDANAAAHALPGTARDAS